ncbi:cytochrome P450 2K6-like isoform X1 [Anolis carolinensis]|uniref:cytochrome P450 2K6-like isoform X1 n=1 Tax=Anolis carolinensis TaxID=28377 RepID=UPI002F2B2494
MCCMNCSHRSWNVFQGFIRRHLRPQRYCFRYQRKKYRNIRSKSPHWSHGFSLITTCLKWGRIRIRMILPLQWMKRTWLTQFMTSFLLDWNLPPQFLNGESSFWQIVQMSKIKIIKEIEDVLGSASICYDDHKRLPYTHAVLHEIERYRFPMIVGVARQATIDIHMRGFIIPKGTYIAPNIRSVLLDEEYWETPLEFNPNHFLDKDGNFVARKEFLGFGTGLRSCLGEAMARMLLFIFLTRLVRVFRFQLPPGVKELNEEPAKEITVPPYPYKVCAIPRNS